MKLANKVIFVTPCIDLISDKGTIKSRATPKIAFLLLHNSWIYLLQDSSFRY
jgi:hypothetical protein